MLAPAFLLGLLAIALPLWLHRMARANPTRAPFPSLMFLARSETQRSARKTLRYWLLLLLRVLLIAALALAFAEPLLEPRADARPLSAPRTHVVLLDASLSMRHTERWNRALEQAQTIVRSVKPDERVLLVRAAGARIEPVAADADRDGVQSALVRLQPGRERLDYGAAMRAAHQWRRDPAAPLTLHFISDFQKSGAPLRFADLEPPQNADFLVHRVDASEAENSYIAALAFSAGERRTLQATLRHAGPRALKRELRLLVDGKEVARRTVELPATAERVESVAGEGGAAPFAARSEPSNAAPATVMVAFTDLELTPGEHRLQLALEPQDELPEDDHFYAVVESAEPQALLIARNTADDEAAYFSAALQAVQAPRMRLEQRSIGGAPADVLAQAALVVVPDLATLPEATARDLQRYVAAGGAVLATLGAEEGAAVRVLLPEWRINTARQRLSRTGKIAAAHPLLREPMQWRRVRFFRQRSIEPAAADRVLIEYDDGAPLLIERTLGAGRLLVFTAPIDRAWNDLAIHPLFVQFIAAAGSYLTGGVTRPVSHTVGEVMPTGLDASSGGQVFGPRGERVLGLAQAQEAARITPESPGFYEVRSRGGGRWLAVNVDARESDLAALPPAYIERWRAMPVRAVQTAPRAERADAKPRSLGPMLLWLAAALLLAEVLVANWRLAIRRGGAAGEAS